MEFCEVATLIINVWTAKSDLKLGTPTLEKFKASISVMSIILRKSQFLHASTPWLWATTPLEFEEGL